MGISKTPKRELFPTWSTEQDSGVTRYSTLPTPDSLKETVLWGIPLVSSLTQTELPDAAIQQFINEAISEFEHTLDLYVLPVTFKERHDYDRHNFTWSFAFTKLYHSNIQTVNKVELSFTNDESDNDLGFIDFPLEHVHVMPIDGTIQLVPAFGTTMSGFLLSAFSGVQYHALRNAMLNSFPGAVRVEYTCGFDSDKVPAIIVQAIKLLAAQKILSTVGPLLFPHSSTSISLDGVSQSTSNPGPQYLSKRLEDINAQLEATMNAVKTQYQKNFLIDSF